MNITAVSMQGSSDCNEDAIIRNDGLGLYGVVDGATSLVPYRSENGDTGGKLASTLIADFLNTQKELSVSGATVGPEALMELLSEANRRLARQMELCGIESARKEQLWTACAVVVRVGERFIDFAHAGDCMLIVTYRDGTIRVVTHDQLASVDERSMQWWVKGMEEGLANREELRDFVKPRIMEGRKLANRPGGYAVLNGDPAFVDYAEFGRLSRTNVESLLLISDGLYIPKPLDASPADGALEVAESVRDKGLERYLEWLIALEESDPDCLRMPRFKKSDDKTAVLVQFNS
ncbi:hypothetical protein DUZ99_03320 [Xylanibacillus composti]|uniref:Serine/threonine protein phosphatase n=1 Tax=Xylanibacillus composti TaxID=1572762 RepID=A0A8J4H8K6_9BACL|nr:protein phosphatase 2C domain-containing protein [Xylanibacillus composti]MDT9724030.1 hypothetical protein [Xylanibacillus composti]GIQ71064.1 serine/threonine protein phosphatase [Xylanibacillus composti]